VEYPVLLLVAPWPLRLEGEALQRWPMPYATGGQTIPGYTWTFLRVLHSRIDVSRSLIYRSLGISQ
jgi:hypothetical protein